MSEEKMKAEEATLKPKPMSDAPKEVVQEVAQESKPKSMFGVSSETKSSNNVPIPPVKKITPNSVYPTGYEFPIARLVNVTFDPEFEKKDKSVVSILNFIFVDKDKRQYIHTEWEVPASDPKYTVKIEGLNSRLAHIIQVIYGGFPEGGIGMNATTYKEYFSAIRDYFHNHLTEGKRTYTLYDYFLKLIYYKSNLGFPLSPNFIEKINPAHPVCKQLSINIKYDDLEPAKSTSSMGGNLGGAMGGEMPGDLPDLEADFE